MDGDDDDTYVRETISLSNLFYNIYSFYQSTNFTHKNWLLIKNLIFDRNNRFVFVNSLHEL